MKNWMCKVFGHKPYKGKITFSFNAKHKDGEWEFYSDTADSIICSRCESVICSPISATINSTEDIYAHNVRLEGEGNQE